LARVDEDRRQGSRLISESEILATAEHLARQFPEVQAIWLFGSYARGQQRRTSDVDFAVMTSQDVCRDFSHRADLIGCAEEFLGAPVDIIPLGSHLSPVLIFEALGNPKLLFARNEATANAFASLLRSVARDDWPRIERRWQRTHDWIDGLRNASSN
jgi:predicted nucleotidyltransferase